MTVVLQLVVLPLELDGVLASVTTSMLRLGLGHLFQSTCSLDTATSRGSTILSF